MSDSQPSTEMLQAAARVASFMETLNDDYLRNTFAASDVVIIENFAPYIFRGERAVQDWAAGFKNHAVGLDQLKHTFGDAQDFSVTGDRAFFTLPTTWEGLTNSIPFSETGGWAFVLAGFERNWKVQSYGWAVTHYEEGGPSQP